MIYNKVVMIMNITDYQLISDEIKNLKIPGVTVSKVEGFGDYINEFNNQGLCDSLKIEIYTHAQQAEKIASNLSLLAINMTEGGGLVAIEPVLNLMNVKKLIA